MSDTPISDSTPHNVAELGMLCRRLERQLNAANSKIELLMSANADVARIAGERDAAEQRIKRLEEAGDALEYASVVLEAGEDPNGFEKLLIAQRKWNKSKEAKP